MALVCRPIGMKLVKRKLRLVLRIVWSIKSGIESCKNVGKLGLIQGILQLKVEENSKKNQLFPKFKKFKTK